MADYKHGEMDIATHEKTFDGFIRTVGWSCVLIVLFLVFLALVNG